LEEAEDLVLQQIQVMALSELEEALQEITDKAVLHLVLKHL
jgi:hypothetical protein